MSRTERRRRGRHGAAPRASSRWTPLRRIVSMLLVAATLAGCTGDDAEPSDAATAEGTGVPTAEDGGAAAPTTDDEPAQGDDDDVEAGPSLAAPARAASVWASSIGLPVVGAVRTSTPLARLSLLPVDEWAATCAQVAAELDTIAPPPVLTALAVTADAETATLLVGDLRAKADLLAVCDEDSEARTVLVDEVAATHEVAVAWLRAIGGRG